MKPQLEPKSLSALSTVMLRRAASTNSSDAAIANGEPGFVCCVMDVDAEMTGGWLT